MYSSHRHSQEHHGHPPQRPPPHHSPSDYHGANGQRTSPHDPYQHSHPDMHSRTRMSSISDTRHTSPTLSRNSLTPMIGQDRPKPFYDVDPRAPYAGQPQYMSRSPVQVRLSPVDDTTFANHDQTRGVLHDQHYRDHDHATPGSRRPSQTSPPQSAHAGDHAFMNPPMPAKPNVSIAPILSPD